MLSPKKIIVFLILWVLVVLFLRVSDPSATVDDAHIARAFASGPVGSPVHVCLCSDDRDLRPAAVAIRSAFTAAREPQRLIFHFITVEKFAPTAESLFREILPDIRIEVHHNSTLDKTIRSMIVWRRTARARRVLTSPFNFAPFYLPQYIQLQTPASRLIYLDTDTLVLGDLAELDGMDMLGHPCAATPFCLQRMEDFMNFDVLTKLGFGKVYDPKSCIANRGLLVVNVPVWEQKGITQKIEQWMERFNSSEKDLWTGGMSQPPWLLAVNGDYLALGDEWNCNSLGRSGMSMWESIALRKTGFDHDALSALEVEYGGYGSISPYLVTCSANAKLLHYNGEMKPWVSDRLRRKPPMCTKPRNVAHNKWSWSRRVQIYCDEVEFVHCPEIWHLFVSEKAKNALRHTDSEWVEEELRWLEQKQDDRELEVKKRKEALKSATKIEEERRQAAVKAEEEKKEEKKKKKR